MIPLNVNKTKRCSCCGLDVRKLLWVRRGADKMEVYVVCPTCDSSTEGGPLNQRDKQEEADA